ncbi:MAG: DUF2062 domain-containing protein [Pseudomonadota bacterium]|nr:DUF2062 domain-containing protein [Pseudomonadota bacterium]
MANGSVRTRSWLDSFVRLTRLKLIVPLKRGQLPPEVIARGVAVGLAVAFTPTVGIQMILVVLLWGLARSLGPRFDFHFLSAVAWVWITNIFTIGPIYYAFLLTGQVMLGRFDEVGSIGFTQFSAQLMDVVSAEAGLLETLWVGTVALFRIWGIPLFIGSIPFAVGSAWVGYAWSKRFVTRFQERRRKRALERAGTTPRRGKATQTSP